MNKLALVIIAALPNNLKPIDFTCGSHCLLYEINCLDETLISVDFLCTVAKVFFVLQLNITFALSHFLCNGFDGIYGT